LKYLIAGLGNIGTEYSFTRHNAGFLIADHLAGENPFTQERYAFYSLLKWKGRFLHIIKPTTYMNLSGKAVKYWMDQLKIEMENILVVADDIALPFGKLRVRKNGSDGGHNGLKNIIETLGNADFPRLRFGVGDEFSKGKQVNYVLGEWTSEEKKFLDEKIKTAADAVKSFTTAGIERTMNIYN
jgi:PTH1 family peptidyl-tRNA hydrolase